MAYWNSSTGPCQQHSRQAVDVLCPNHKMGANSASACTYQVGCNSANLRCHLRFTHQSDLVHMAVFKHGGRNCTRLLQYIDLRPQAIPLVLLRSLKAVYEPHQIQ